MNPEKRSNNDFVSDYIHTEYWNKKQNNQNELKKCDCKISKTNF